LAQRGADVVRLVVDRGVVAVELTQVAHLLRAARDPDRSAASELRELPDDLADRPGRRRDDDRVSRPRPPDVEQPEVRRESRRADDVERERGRLKHLRNAAERARASDGELLPAELADHEISRGEARVPALHHLAERPGGDY